VTEYSQPSVISPPCKAAWTTSGSTVRELRPASASALLHTGASNNNRKAP